MADAAMRYDTDEQNTDETQVVTFHVNGEEYGIPIVQVQEILRMGQIRRLPTAPAYVEGIMALRSGVLLVVDLRARLNLPPQARTKKNRIVVINSQGRTLGLVVDSVTAVRRLPRSGIQSVSELCGLVSAQHVSGIARHDTRLIIMLDPDALASGNDLQAVTPSDLGFGA